MGTGNNFSLFLLSLRFVHSADMIVCSKNYCECIMKLCPEEKRKCFVKVTFKMLDIQLNKKRLSNFKTYYFITLPRSLGHYQNIKMIFCKRRIGFINFSGYYNRKRVRRWPFFCKLVT